MDRAVGAEDRLAWLSGQLASDGSITVAAAAAELNVSEMTIRRDLLELEDRGAARRVRGGARAVGPQTFTERRQHMARAKSMIAAKVAALVPSSGAVAFDASSTLMRLTNDLVARDLLVLTNGPDTFAALQNQRGVTPLLTGGRLDERTGSLVGALACRSASQITVQRLFASAAAIDVHVGALEATLDEAEVKRSMAAVADEVVLAVDSSKFDDRGVAVGLEWDRIDVLVTELDPADARLAPYRHLARLL